ncbi:hypothetical protein APSETT444_010338 [Aspergillus pseudonomiae]
MPRGRASEGTAALHRWLRRRTPDLLSVDEMRRELIDLQYEIETAREQIKKKEQRISLLQKELSDHAPVSRDSTIEPDYEFIGKNIVQKAPDRFPQSFEDSEQVDKM